MTLDHFGHVLKLSRHSERPNSTWTCMFLQSAKSLRDKLLHKKKARLRKITR